MLFKTIGKTIKFLGTVLGRNRPKAAAHGAWLWRGHGLAARCSRAAACAHTRSHAQRASAAWSPRKGRRGGVFADGPSAANRWQGAPQEHQRLFGVTPGKAGGGGAYPNDGAVGRRKRGSGQRRSPARRELRWAATVGVGSCSTGVEGGREN
jgi:hypothetical protein